MLVKLQGNVQGLVDVCYTVQITTIQTFRLLLPNSRALQSILVGRCVRLVSEVGCRQGNKVLG